MSRFDDELREALKRVDPPDGFSERVLARVAEERAKPSLIERFRRALWAPRMRWAAVGALSLAILAGVQHQRAVEQRARGEQAKEQVLLALRITAEQIQTAERGVRKLNASW